MLAIDTNVLVRFLTNDNVRQAARAREIIEQSEVFVPVTVLLETEWVLRSTYEFPRAEILRILKALAGLPHINFESPELVSRALAAADGGVDFADALHLAGAQSCEAFVTFDRNLAKEARRLSLIPVRAL